MLLLQILFFLFQLLQFGKLNQGYVTIAFLCYQTKYVFIAGL